MKCRIVRRKLIAYLDGELRERQRILIEEHLSQCDKCREEAGLLVKTSNFLKNWENIEPSENLEANFWRRVSSEKEREALSQPILRQLTRFALPAAVAAALTAGVILGNLVGKTMSSQAVSSWEEEYVSRVGLDSFQDSPSGSLSEVYFNLASEE
jgi:anti-sigma factor RsiW